MKRGIYLISTVFLIVLLLTLITVAAAEDSIAGLTNSTPAIKEIGKGFSESLNKTNPWNETVIISPVWQILIGGFFGLNLHSESTAISMTETIILFMVFIMFLVIILDILKMIPLFEGEIIMISKKFLIAFVITTFTSIMGLFISLKNLFMDATTYTVSSLDWAWLNNAIANKGFWAFFMGAIVVLIIFIIHQILSWLKPIIEKYSKVSYAEAKGRRIGEAIKSMEEKED